MVHPTYAGCWLTEPIANLVGLPIDQFNFMSCQFLGIFFGLFFHLKLQPPDTSPTLRHIYCLVVGLTTLWFCNGWETWHLVLQSSVCYIMMNTFPPQIMHMCVLIFSLGYLVAMCLYRYLLPEDMQFLDITFPCTVSVQKLSSLAFSITDYHRYKLDSSCLTDAQRKRVISRPPNLLKFFSYMFYFQGILAGPFTFYNDYIDFIDGRHITSRLETKDDDKKPLVDPKSISPLRVVFYKCVMLGAWVYLYLHVSCVLVPTTYNADPDFIQRHTVIYRLGYMYLSMLCHRSRYFLTWTLADIVYNASGYGFNGLDASGNAKWDMLTNIRVEKIETATSFKTFIDNWNIQTTKWLRYVCYERAPFLRTHLTYILSAVWHGVYPGFYCTFLSAIWFTLAGRKIRRNIRPHFQESAGMRALYEVLTWFGTQLPMAYIVLPFTYLNVAPFITFYNSVFWCFHVLVAVILLIPFDSKQARHRQDPTKTSTPQTEVTSDPGRLSNGNSQRNSTQDTS
ncbi:lysophospholipid acyltransferase 2-like [Haliotis asinina]|uniref:lysophospholipid acyltransferase 2-like n=1 Tax=Haliotis asinina TaxID=109174 RepID=UPI003531A5B8